MKNYKRKERNQQTVTERYFKDEPEATDSGMYLSLLADQPGEAEAAMILNSLVDEPETQQRNENRL